MITIVIIPLENADDSEMQCKDEVKQYLDCRYISLFEDCWRTFVFTIHGRTLAIERLYFHFPREQFVLFGDFEDIDSLLSKPTVKVLVFTSWL